MDFEESLLATYVVCCQLKKLGNMCKMMFWTGKDQKRYRNHLGFLITSDFFLKANLILHPFRSLCLIKKFNN